MCCNHFQKPTLASNLAEAWTDLDEGGGDKAEDDLGNYPNRMAEDRRQSDPIRRSTQTGRRNG